MKISIIIYMLQQAIGVFGNNPRCEFTGRMKCSWEEIDGYKHEFTIKYIDSKRVVYCDREPNSKEMTIGSWPWIGCEYANTFKKDFVSFSDKQQEVTKAEASTWDLTYFATIVSRLGVNFGPHEISFDLNENAECKVSSNVFNYLKENLLHDLCIKVHEREFCPIFQEKMDIKVCVAKDDSFVLNIGAMIHYNARFVNTRERGFQVQFGLEAEQ
ncbi:hypothetical protein ABG067_005264 [Albugo candida]